MQSHIIVQSRVNAAGSQPQRYRTEAKIEEMTRKREAEQRKGCQGGTEGRNPIGAELPDQLGAEKARNHRAGINDGSHHTAERKREAVFGINLAPPIR